MMDAPGQDGAPLDIDKVAVQEHAGQDGAPGIQGPAGAPGDDGAPGSRRSTRNYWC